MMTDPYVPDFTASESAAINIVAAWEWFREARDVITAARDAQRLVSTLKGHVADLEGRITALDTELSGKADTLTRQREEIRVAGEQARAAVEEILTTHSAQVQAAIRELDRSFEAYRDGEVAAQRSALSEELLLLAARRDGLAAGVRELELRAAEAQTQLDLVRSMVSGRG